MDNAKKAFTDQETAAKATAAAVATPLADLAKLRTTADTATKNLSTAIGNLEDQKIAISKKQSEVDAKKKD